MTEMISSTVRIRVSGVLPKAQAGMLAECMNRLVGQDLRAPSLPFCAMRADQDMPGEDSWAVFVRNNAIRAL